VKTLVRLTLGKGGRAVGVCAITRPHIEDSSWPWAGPVAYDAQCMIRGYVVRDYNVEKKGRIAFDFDFERGARKKIVSPVGA
jgi:hypothetical protein